MTTFDIHEFARRGNLDSLRQAIDASVDLDAKDQFETTALQYAIAERQFSAIDLLLESGADVLAQDRDGKTALHYAVEYNMASVVEKLLRKQPEVISVSDKYGNQPLWTAAFNARGNHEIVKILLRHGGDPEHRNNANLSPLDIPKRKGEPALLDLLISRGK